MTLAGVPSPPPPLRLFLSVKPVGRNLFSKVWRTFHVKLKLFLCLRKLVFRVCIKIKDEVNRWKLTTTRKAGCLAFLTSRLFRAVSTPIIYSMYIFIFPFVIIMGWNKELLLLLMLLLLWRRRLFTTSPSFSKLSRLFH